MTVTFEDIQQAASTIAGKIEETPCVHSRTLSQITGAEVYLKFENLQFTASFKERGALNKLYSFTPEQRKKGVIAMSAGNHAQAVAYHAQQLSIPAVIVMPRFTPNIKVEHTRTFGAEVILHGDSLNDAATHALELAEQRQLLLVHPYDDEHIIAGQGTIALEMLNKVPDLDAMIIPIGGGGLIAGNAIAAKTLRPDLRIFGVETEHFPSMLSALQGKAVQYGTTSIAEGIAVKQPGHLTLPVVRELVNEIFLVDETNIEEAVLLLLEVEKTVTEGAGAAGLAALLNNREQFTGQRVGLVLSGGNIDMPILSSIIERGLVRSQRMIRIRIDMHDVPGTLADVTSSIENTGANIVHVHHHRTFTGQPVQNVEVEFILNTRGKEHTQLIMQSLLKHKFIARIH